METKCDNQDLFAPQCNKNLKNKIKNKHWRQKWDRNWYTIRLHEGTLGLFQKITIKFDLVNSQYVPHYFTCTSHNEFNRSKIQNAMWQWMHEFPLQVCNVFGILKWCFEMLSIFHMHKCIFIWMMMIRTLFDKVKLHFQL